MTIELWAYERDLLSNMRIFDFAVTAVNSNGQPTGVPTADRFALMSNANNGIYRVDVSLTGTALTSVSSTADFLRSGSWTHYAVTTRINPNVASTATNAAVTSLYVNGILAANGTSYLPRNVTRTVNWIGRAAGTAATESNELMFVDSVALYSYPMSADAIFAHMQTSQPPRFEITFSKDPSTITRATNPTFSYVAADGIVKGIVALNGIDQSINLLLSNGPSSVGTTVLHSYGDASRWSYVIAAKFNVITFGASIFEFKGAADHWRLFIDSTGHIAFKSATSNIDESVPVTSRLVVVPNVWYIIALVIRDGQVTLLINGVVENSGSMSSSGNVQFTEAFLGKSISTVPVFMNGMIDSFRIYQSALPQEEVAALYTALTTVPTGVVEKLRYAPVAPQSSPVVSYTFSKDVPEFGTASFTNYSQLDSYLDRSGMAFFDGSNQLIHLTEYPADSSSTMPFMPTYFGGEMSVEFSCQFLSSANEAAVFSFSGPKANMDMTIQFGNTWVNDGDNINSMITEVFGDRTISKRSTTTCSGCVNGTWSHVIVTIKQLNASDWTSATSATITLYVNGILVSSKNGWLPPLAYRPNLYLGKSDSTESLFYGSIDAFHW